MTVLDGPRLAPLSGGPAKSLVVFLHGYGADGNDLIDIGRMWAPVMPETAFVSPHAPQPCAEAPVGRQWFPLAGTDQQKLREGVLAAAPVLDAFLDAELAAHGLGDDRLALVGFSQGTMMALHVGPRRAHPIAGIVGYSGLLPGPEFLKAEARQRPPVLLIHGDADPLIPAMALHVASRILGEAGFRSSGMSAPGWSMASTRRASPGAPTSCGGCWPRRWRGWRHSPPSSVSPFSFFAALSSIATSGVARPATSVEFEGMADGVGQRGEVGLDGAQVAGHRVHTPRRGLRWRGRVHGLAACARRPVPGSRRARC